MSRFSQTQLCKCFFMFIFAAGRAKALNEFVIRLNERWRQMRKYVATMEYATLTTHVCHVHACASVCVGVNPAHTYTDTYNCAPCTCSAATAAGNLAMACTLSSGLSIGNAWHTHTHAHAHAHATVTVNHLHLPPSPLACSRLQLPFQFSLILCN